MHDHDVTSPELILVSPPDVAARARAALPDYAHEYEVARVRAAYARAAVVPAARVAPTARDQVRGHVRGPGPKEPATALDHGLSRGSITFLTLVVLNCVAPFVLLILSRA